MSSVLVPIHVATRVDVDDVIRAVWKPLTAHLALSEIEAALAFFSPGVRDRYRTLLTDVETGLAGLFATPPELLQVGVGDGVAEYLLETSEAAEIFGVRIHFTRSTDGVWRMTAF